MSGAWWGRGASIHLGVTRTPSWWSSLAHGETQGSPREGSKKPSASCEVSYGLASDVTERHFYHILLVTGQPRGQPDSTLYKACGRRYDYVHLCENTICHRGEGEGQQ